MSGQTEFAGLEELAPGDMLSADGYRFQAVNPGITDKLLRVGAVTHKHDAHAALANPGVAPTVATKATGGTIPSSTLVSVVHTWVDKHGGETLPSPVGTKETAAGLPDPGKAPTAVADYTAGALLAGNWTYALTVADGVGGETAIGPSVTVTVDPGFAKARVDLSGLKVILEEVTVAAGAEWRLWRKQEGGAWYLMSTGKGATLDDEGTLPGDCTVEPPEVSTSLGTNLIEVTVPAEPEGTEFFRLYICTDGLFTSPCFVAQYPLSEIGKVITLTALALLPGLPPLVSESFPGADKIDPNTDLIEWHWKRPVKKASELPTEGNEEGDIRVSVEDRVIHIWNNVAKKWEGTKSAMVDWLSPVAKASELPTEGNAEGDVRLVEETQQLWVWDNVGKEWEPLIGHVHTCETQTWSVAGALTAGTIPGPFVKVLANEAQKLLGIECILGAGKATLTLKHNGVAIAELTGLKVEGGVYAVTLAEPLALASKDTLTLEVVSSEGGTGMAFSAFIEHVGLVV